MDFDKTVSIIILIILIIGVIGVVYIILNPVESKGFTEFYILNSNGSAGNYPTNLTIGDKGNIIIGITNNEHLNSNYLVKIKRNNTLLKQENVSLGNGEKKEITYNFTAATTGQYKLEFDLYKLPDTNNIYRSVFLWVNVKGY
ncbi:DUF1616 domain-containing protein [Methanobacterium formicicum]|uniref:DUF1616 domain-containing protein n=1 Tax=Methanobacterium formicicum (strain DSM 3637 / PP1) TaxID=1204725 RepID=K2RQS2_METFP|nr:DUF1616 domain-containing protein [Methanobacterium formicicum]EKF85115.1 hypothetical protein A994_10869 [Methanobacterium formicicum DSM 3637]